MTKRADDVLGYLDQGSFMGMRALGRGFVLHFTWIYPRAPDESAVEQFNEALAQQGLMGRLIHRSPLPFGRHRWVTNPFPAQVTWFREPIPLARVQTWRSGLINLSIDPEHGPGWRLAAQALEGGGLALSFLVSHTIADGMAAIEAIADAVAGRRSDMGFPPRARRWSPTRLARDIRESLRALPDVGRALTTLARRPPHVEGANKGSVLRPQHPNGSDQTGSVVEMPLVMVTMDAAAFDARAADHGVRRNTLFLMFASRLAFGMGRLDTAGRVRLTLPVSDRQPGDRRGNALQSVTVMADPEACLVEPLALQTALKAALERLRQHGDNLLPLLPLVPYVPDWLTRRLERLTLWTGRPVGCSIVGDLPPELSGPCGPAAQLQFSSLEPLTEADFDQRDGKLLLGFYRVEGQLLISVLGYAPKRTTTRETLAPLVRAALADLGLEGLVDP